MILRRGGLVLGTLFLLPMAVVGQVPPPPAAPAAAVVRAVLFHSPSCPHCRELIATGLPPLQRRFGARLQIAFVDASTAAGNSLFNVSLDQFGVPAQQRGVPTLLVGARMLVGSDEIPAELPGLVERGLAAGGVDWPAVPALREALATWGRRPDAQPAARPAISPDTDAAAVAAPVALDQPTPSSAVSIADKFRLDPIGNSVSVIVLLFMVTVVVLVAGAMRGRDVRLPNLPRWSVPVLAMLGAGVAAYLAFVEVTGAQAVCGPVGDCNTVQQSAYARLFGVPVGLLGVGGYLAMAVAWIVGALGKARTSNVAWLAIWTMALLATLFSIYLTFLEPFVIGASCAWCITSALIVTLILLAATPHAARTLVR